MANASIPSLPVATILDGTEQLEIVQPAGSGGTTKRATSGQIAGLSSAGGVVPTSSFILATSNAGLPNSRTLAVYTSDIVYTDTGALGTATIGPINTAAISYAKFQQTPPLSVLGQSSTATGIINSMAGTTDQVFRVSPSGGSLGFGQINLSATSAVTGFLATSYFTGILGVPGGGTGTSTLTANGALIGNGTSSVLIATAKVSGYVLTDNGTGSQPTFSPVTLTSATVTGILTVPFGGTGTTALTANGVLVGNGTSAVLIATAKVSGYVLTDNGTGSQPTFSPVTLTSTTVTGTLTVPFGGTGATTLSAFGVIYGNGTSAVGVATAGTAGQLLVGQTSTSAPIFRTSTGDVAYSAVGTATIATGVVTFSKIQTMTGLSVMGVTGTATTNASTITGTAGQVLVVNSGGTALIFGQVNLAATTSGVTGVLPLANGGTNASTAASAIINLNGLALNTTGQAFTGGVILTALSLGTAAASTVTFVAGNPPLQRIIINGTATFVAPSSDCEFDLLVTNAGSASSITFSGYGTPASTGDTYATTSGNKYIFMSRTINASSTYAWKAFQ